jgi:hypothetical protein
MSHEILEGYSSFLRERISRERESGTTELLALPWAPAFAGVTLTR